MSFLPRRAAAASFFALLVWLTAGRSASAYCRKTSNGPADASYDPASTGTCGDGPGALPLYWRPACIEYRVIVEPEVIGDKKITLETARAIAASAAKAWSEAPCPRVKGGTRSPTIRIVDVDAARCSDGAPGTAANTTNEIRFRGAPPPTPGVLAVTTVLSGVSSGMITEASIAIFETDAFSAYAADPNGLEQSFAAIVRHEMGHFLGLAHSNVNTAIMYAFYNSNPSPGLTDDDVAAICDAYDPTAPVGDGCSVASAGPMPSTHTSALSLSDSRGALAPLFLGAVAVVSLGLRARAGRRKAHGSRQRQPKAP